MRTDDVAESLTTLFRELVHGASPALGYVLNRGDPGLLGSLDRLTAEDASATGRGGVSVAAHVDHLRYALSLLNRWAAGEEPFRDADWSASWRLGPVAEREWADLRIRLRGEAEHWFATLGAPRDVTPAELHDMMGSIVHVAYHLGALRQIERQLRGPSATEAAQPRP